MTSEAGTDTGKLKVLVSGGGPVGLAFALLLVNKMGSNVEVRIYDLRWRKDDQGRVVWKGEEDRNARRQQVVTIQSRQFLRLPATVQDRLFKNGGYTEMWPLGPDSIQKTRPRNIRVADVEDELLAMANDAAEITLVPEPFSAELMGDLIREHHLFVIAEGARSSSFEYLKDHFGAPNDTMYRLSGSHISDFVLGLRVKSRLQDSAAVLLTVMQNRFLLNSKSGDGFLNMRLAPSEVREVRGFIDNGNEFLVVDCIQSRPCLMESGTRGMFVCKTHGSIFGPKFITTSQLWPRIKHGLRLFGVRPNDLSAVTAFRLEMIHRPRFTIPYIERTSTSPGTYALLIGDSANAIHFWPGRGLNSGLASAISLARCASSRWKGRGYRDSDFARHEAVMAMLQYRHKARAWRAMAVADSEGKLRAIKDTIEASLAAQPPDTDIEATLDDEKRAELEAAERNAKQECIAKLVERAAGIRTRLGERLNGLPNDQELREILSTVDAQTLRVMYESGPWDAYSSGGEEVDVDSFYESAASNDQGAPGPKRKAREIVRRGTHDGRPVVQYDSGEVEYAD